MDVRLVIYGVPGTGKSTLGPLAAEQLGVPYLEVDLLRPTDPPAPDEDPFLHDYTTSAWANFGPLSARTAIEGFLAVRRAFAPRVTARLAEQPGFVAESAVLDPTALAPAAAVLLINSDVRAHHERFFIHRARGSTGEAQFAAACYIQDYLQDEADDRQIPIVDVASSPDRTLLLRVLSAVPERMLE